MALIRLDHVPETVKVNLPLYIILPDPGKLGEIPLRERKVLYLLHGLSDDASAWSRYSKVETLAAAYGLVVVMPSVGRSFYTDQPNGLRYFSYLVDELPCYLRDVFGLSPPRDGTLIAGNSMGGYGAFKAALLYPHQYAAAASFSGVLSLSILSINPQDPRREEFSWLFGDLQTLAGGSHDPLTWLRNAARNKAGVPKMYIAVSRQEDIYPLSPQFHAACQQMGVDSTYLEEDGGHDWLTWDRFLKWFLEDTLGPVPR